MSERDVRRDGIYCAHEIADVCGRKPILVEKFLRALPDNPPGFESALDWAKDNTPMMVDALENLRRSYVINAWRDKEKKLRIKVDEGGLDAAWENALRYARKFANQEDMMALATDEEKEKAMAFMRMQVRKAVEKGQDPDKRTVRPALPRNATTRDKARAILQESKS